MMDKELVLSDAEYYDLFKALHIAIEAIPDSFADRNKGLLERMRQFYKDSPAIECEFVISIRVSGSEATP